jgi:hypothetical protein
VTTFQEGNSGTREGDRVESLRLILEREQGRPVLFEEAAEVANALISLYEALAQPSRDALAYEAEIVKA